MKIVKLILLGQMDGAKLFKIEGTETIVQLTDAEIAQLPNIEQLAPMQGIDKAEARDVFERLINNAQRELSRLLSGPTAAKRPVPTPVQTPTPPQQRPVSAAPAPARATPVPAPATGSALEELLGEDISANLPYTVNQNADRDAGDMTLAEVEVLVNGYNNGSEGIKSRIVKRFHVMTFAHLVRIKSLLPIGLRESIVSHHAERLPTNANTPGANAFLPNTLAELLDEGAEKILDSLPLDGFDTAGGDARNLHETSSIPDALKNQLLRVEQRSIGGISDADISAAASRIAAQS